MTANETIDNDTVAIAENDYARMVEAISVTRRQLTYAATLRANHHVKNHIQLQVRALRSLDSTNFMIIEVTPEDAL